MKNKIFTTLIALSLLVLAGCSNQKNVTTVNMEKPTINTEESKINILPKDEDGIVKLIKSNELVGTNLLSLCIEGQENCINSLFYKVDTANPGYYLIAFLGSNESIEYKNNPFKYSTEIYKVDMVNGDILRLSPFAGNYEYLTNLLNK